MGLSIHGGKCVPQFLERLKWEHFVRKPLCFWIVDVVVVDDDVVDVVVVVRCS